MTRMKMICLCVFLAAVVPVGMVIAQEDTSSNEESEILLEDVVVTGSRVITTGDDFPTPVTVVPNDQLLKMSPANIPEGLNKLPVFSGVNGQRLGFSLGENLAGNYLNLRQFGAERTLILLDGKRVVPTTARGLTDANLMPQMLVERIDVVTGGASAVYGSDAITGVVNYVLDRHFQGLKVQASAGVSGESDYNQNRLGLAFGTSLLGGRGHLIGSLEYFDNDGLTTDDRESTRRVYLTTGRGTADNPYVIDRDVRWAGGGSPLGLYIFSLGPNFAPDFSLPFDQVFLPGGDIRPFQHGESTGSAGYEIGGDGMYFKPTSAAANLSTLNFFARFGYDVTDYIEAYVQGGYAESENKGTFAPFTYFPMIISSDNAFLAPSLASTLQAAGSPGFGFTKSSYEVPGVKNDAHMENYSVAAGIKGRLTDSLKFDVSFSHGETEQHIKDVNNINVAKTAAAVDAVLSGSDIVCRITLTNPGLYPGCVPLNPFGVGSESAEAFDYVTDVTDYKLTNTLDDFNASISGSLFDNWVGPVNFALSVEYRKSTLENKSSHEPTDVPDCTGLSPFNCGSNDYFGTGFFAMPYTGNLAANIPEVSQDVKEVALEVNVPLLADAPFAKRLDLNGAYRYADYEAVGGADTWKLGAVWDPVNDVTIRGSYSRDFRAPTLYELFGPGRRYNAGGVFDNHTNTDVPLVTNFETQNPDLKPEEADTITAGIVYRPSGIPGLSLALDYYTIEIDNAIGGISGRNATVQQICEDSNGTSELCDLIVRPGPFSDTSPENALTGFIERPMNASKTEINGFDFEVNYATDLGPGDLSARVLATYTPHYRIQQLVGVEIQDTAGTAAGGFGGGVPEYKLTALVNYTLGDYSVDIVERWRSSMKRSPDPDLVFADGDVDSVAYTDLTLTARPSFLEHFEVYLSIQNLFDKESPIYAFPGNALPGWGGAPYLANDDFIGRYFTLGARVQF